MSNDRDNEERYIVPAVEQACQILFRLAGAESGRMNLQDICTQVGIHKSKAFSVLQTLQKFGLVQTGGRGKGYTLGPGLIGLSRRFLDTLSAPKLAEPILADLAKKTGATAVLGLIAGKNVFVAAKNEGEGPIVVTMRVGHRFPLTYGCHGKAVAAFLNEKDLHSLLGDKKLYFHGKPAKFDLEKLMEDIRECRRTWFAEDFEETAPGRFAIAAPVLGPNGYPIGYVLLIGLANAETARERGPLIAAAGRTLSKQLGAALDAPRNPDLPGDHDES